MSGGFCSIANFLQVYPDPGGHLNSPMPLSSDRSHFFLNNLAEFRRLFSVPFPLTFVPEKGLDDQALWKHLRPPTFFRRQPFPPGRISLSMTPLKPSSDERRSCEESSVRN